MKNAVYVVVGIVLGMVAVEVIRGAEILQADASTDRGFPGEEGMMFGTGGSSDNKMDACWVLDRGKDKAGKPKTTLSLYSIIGNGKGMAIQYQDSRRIDWDLRVTQFRGMKPSVKTVKSAVEKAEQREADKKVKPKED